MLDEERLREALPIGRLGSRLSVYSSIESTNDEAAKQAQDGAPEGSLVAANEQTAGRGRAGRTWDTRSDSGLALSVVLRPQSKHLTALGLVGAMATIEALVELGMRAQLKWPNDVLLEERKVAGVLPEASWLGATLEYAIVGIGVNVTADSLFREAEYEHPATYVEAVHGAEIDMTGLLLRVLHGFDLWYSRLLAGNAHPRWEEYLAFQHQVVSVTSGGELIQGRLIGLSATGRLLLEADDGTKLLIDTDASGMRPTDPGLA